MKKHMLKNIAVSALTAGAMLLNFSAVLPVSAEEPDEYHDDWLHVENGVVVDKDGNEVWMTGVNWFGYNVGSQVFDGVWSANMHDCLNLISDHGFNLLRVPMSTEIILQWKNGDPDPMIKVNEYSNPELTEEGVVGGKVKYSFDIWNQAVAWCRENGIKIMMDIHSASTNAAGHQYPLWYDENFSTDDWLEALSWFCEYYKDDDTIIAIDLKNEPHGKPEEGKFAKWDNSKDENNWKYAAERGAMACLEQNPNLLIMVEGTECYPDFSRGADWTTPSVDYAHYGEPSKIFGAWWGGNLRGVKDYPIDIGEYTKQIVYSPHDYGPEVYKQNWFYLDDDSKTFTRQTLLDDYWYDSWAYLVEEKRYPLLMGEWGGWVDEEHDKTGENRHWLQEIRDYMTDMHIHHTFWCFNENSSDTGGLVYDNFGKWDDVKYDFIKSALWQTEDGKFISLDHKIPIGKNGISLSEYYGTSSSDTPVKPTEKETEAQTESASETVPATETEKISESVSESATEANTGTLGDVDENGSIDILDVIMLNKNLLGKETFNETQMKLADVNQSGVPDSDDAIRILKYIVGLIKDFTS